MNGSTGFTSVNTPSAPPPPPSAAPPPTATGSKRKRDAQLKFYAVRIGKEPGIYHTWAACLDQVRGFPRAMFKSFTSLSDAQSYLAGENDHTSGIGGSGKSSGTPQKWYGVQVGRVPGVYTNWQDVLDQIRGWKGPKHKGFKTRIEAELYVREGQKDNQQQQNAEHAMESIEDADQPASKKAKKDSLFKKENISPDDFNHDVAVKTDYAAGEAPLNGAEDDFDNKITIDQSTGSLRYKTEEERSKIKYQAVRPVPEAPIRIYTDGSSLSNGMVSAIGGVGVYFGPGDKRNISEGLPGTKQTNQRAELTAILRALEVAPKDRRIIIFSDSNYAIKCATEWFQNWRRNNWQNASRKPVENKDLVQKLIDGLEERYQMNRHRSQGFEDDEEGIEDDGKPPQYWEKGLAGVKFVWVKGHAKDEGNNAADDLATAGAMDARELVNGDLES